MTLLTFDNNNVFQTVDISLVLIHQPIGYTVNLIYISDVSNRSMIGDAEILLIC